MSLALCNFLTHAILQTIQKIPLNVMTLEIVTKRVYTAKVNPCQYCGNILMNTKLSNRTI